MKNKKDKRRYFNHLVIYVVGILSLISLLIQKKEIIEE